ncbi:MAG: 2-succinyl-5-enolpyruvyl-6-hydroxy-3-cyclohexene-1-carboxylic-acid synthase [Pirellulaceae bacterium]
MTDQIWADVAIHCCLKRGIDHFFVAPGSRCTPLTLAIARNQHTRVVQHFDERGLAFAAVGYARATGKPGVFVCTSGTAVANALPAVIESAMDHIPLILFTADRPDGLRGIGANQTIDQYEIFGRYPRHFINLPVPQDKDSASDPQGREFLTSQLSEGIVSTETGPVHFNWMFREPFTISDECEHEASSLASPAENQEPKQGVLPLIEVKGNTLIALGNCHQSEALHASQLAKRLRCPILSDITSGLDAPSFELPTEFDLPRPDTVLHLGDRITSKSWIKWTQETAQLGTQFIHCTSTGQVINPAKVEQRHFHVPFTDLETRVVGEPSQAKFADAWSKAAKLRNQTIKNVLAEPEPLSEPAVSFFLSQELPPTSGLFIGNSMPIRDMDWFCERGDGDTVRNVAANRGASGIDGLIATAVGYAAGLQQPTTVLLGDLSALHDLNSMALVASSAWPLIIVVINNQGGHIFDLLPIRESKHFEQFFNTPHDFQFDGVAKMFGLPFKRVSQMDDFKEAYQIAASLNQSQVIEVATDRRTNIETRQRITKAIQACSKQG